MAAAKKKKNVPTKISKNKMFKKKTKSFPKKRKEDSGVKESLPDGSKVEVFDIASTCNQDSFRKHKRVPMKDKGGKFKALRAKNESVPARKLVDEKVIQRYKRGKRVKLQNMKTRFHKSYYKKKEKLLDFAAEQSARSELLLQEETGYMDDSLVSQQKIASEVDITSATKFFELNLEFGPYKTDYTRNGQFLLLGGKKGHVAALEWQTKKLLSEFNVMETVTDIQWLHQETMFAVGQKRWTYIYDNQGIELHCLKILNHTTKMEYLPYHFLLVAGNAEGFLTYLDTSIGKKIVSLRTLQGSLNVMCQNPSNAIIHLGHHNGTVTLWSPNVKSHLVKVLCHRSNVRAVAVDSQGQYMATSGNDCLLKIWDLRTYGLLQSYRISTGASCLSFSQKGMLAAGVGNIVQVYDDCCSKTVTSPYLLHRLPSRVQHVKFCPYEDVLGVGHEKGFQSLLVPGAGEASFDAYEVNPFQSKSQRRETEVKMLLDKIQPSMIHLDSKKILEPDMKSTEEIMDEKKKQIGVTSKTNFKLKNKMKGGNRAGNVMKRKSAIKDEQKRNIRKTHLMEQKEKEWKAKYNIETDKA